MNLKFVNLDAEAVKKAETYIPLAEKCAICKILAHGCIERAESENDIPPRWQESIMGKRVLSMYILAGLYMKLIDVQELYDETPKVTFSCQQYDQFSQIYHQLERMKKGKDEELREIAGAILSDYREFERLLSAEVYNLLLSRNDTCSRVWEMVKAQTTPEAFKATLEEFEKATKELEKQKKIHAGILKGGNTGAVSDLPVQPG